MPQQRTYDLVIRIPIRLDFEGGWEDADELPDTLAEIAACYAESEDPADRDGNVWNRKGFLLCRVANEGIPDD